MNTVALRLLGIALVIAVLTLLFVWFFQKELVQRAKQIVAWLLRVSFFDFVQMVIFIKPLKKHVIPVGVGVWLILAYVTGRYLIVTQPKLPDIPGPYIPMIGYLYYLSALFIIGFVLSVSKPTD